MGSNAGTWLLVPDCHIPYENGPAFDLMLETAHRVRKLAGIIILGDFWDCYAISDHLKDPSRGTDMAEELYKVNDRLDDLDQLGAKRKIYLAGNHEDRLRRELWKKMPQLSRVVSLQQQLRLDKRGWEYRPYAEHVKVGKFTFVHDVGYTGQHAAIRNAAAAGSNIITGHTHTMQVHYFGDINGNQHVSATMGWLGDVSAVSEYKMRLKAEREWSHGFGAMQLDDIGICHLQALRIVGSGHKLRCGKIA